MERRAFEVKELRVERVEGKGAKLGGYAAVFDSESVDLGGFTERIARGAFENALKGDVRALVNHDPNLILGRTKAGTLKLAENERGLAFEVDLPDTGAGRDIAVSVERGDITGMSFAFNIAKGGDVWAKVGPNQWLRTLLNIDKLPDVSPVTYPAYPSAEVALRAADGAAEALAGLAKAKAEDEARGRRLRLLERETRA